MQSTLRYVWRGVRKIQFAEKLSRLITDRRLSSNCQSKDYNMFKAMVIEAGRSAINIDCKILMQYSPDLFMTKKDYCLKHYVDEIEMTIKLVSLNNKFFWNALKDCVYKNFGMDFSDNYIISKNNYIINMLENGALPCHMKTWYMHLQECNSVLLLLKL